jgi:hypothetical protein
MYDLVTISSMERKKMRKKCGKKDNINKNIIHN